MWEAEKAKEEQTPKTECSGVCDGRGSQSSEFGGSRSQAQGAEKLGCSTVLGLFPGRGTKWWAVESYGAIYLLLAARDVLNTDYYQK